MDLGEYPAPVTLREQIRADWLAALAGAIADPSFTLLEAFLEQERADGEVYPPRDQVFEALRLTPPGSVRAVIVGQDPYPGRGQAHGLAFSVPAGVKKPPSLRNILKELERDLGYPDPPSGSLVPWAEHGVLLLNTVLTVRAGVAGSHAGRGWERFTDAVIRAVDAKPGPVAFLLWGRRAQQKARLIHAPHVVIAAPHPSRAARWGFRGCAPFSRANAALIDLGCSPIDWSLAPAAQPWAARSPRHRRALGVACLARSPGPRRLRTPRRARRLSPR